MRRKSRRWLAIAAGGAGVSLLGLWLFVPRKVFWVELGRFAYQPGGMDRPATVVARPVRGDQWKQVRFEDRRISIYGTDTLSQTYYHLWAVDTSACRFFMWTRRNRNLIHLGGPEASLHLTRFTVEGESYLGEHDFNSVFDLVKCPRDADDEAIFELATAYARRRIEESAARRPQR
ncbi:MAG: hypothetical protein ACYS9X_22895 [Planctomycetota bacterium]|jgi:hypothetical protein